MTLACLLIFLGFSACNGQERPVSADELAASQAEHERLLGRLSADDRMDSLFAQHEARFAPIQVDRAGAARWVEETLASLTLDQKIGQLILVDLPPAGIRRAVQDRAMDAVQRHHVGGFLVPRLMDPRDVYRSTRRLQQASGVPLFFAADYERGVGRHINALTEVPSNMAIGATRDTVYAAAAGRITAIEARATGVNLLFAPVVDVNNNPANPIINIRSYGEDPALVASMGAAFVHESEAYGGLTTLKHFPGHGNTSVDSHARMGTVPGDRAELDRIELAPYRQILALPNPPASVMTAHLWIEGIDPQPLPATFSRRAMTDVLRGDLGFEGFVVTDDVKMGALQNHFTLAERVVRPLEAGVDVILTPENVSTAVNAIRSAVQSGRLTEERIDQSVRRVLTAKARAGLHLNPFGSEEDIDFLLDRHRGAYLAQQIADDAVTLVQTHPALPIRDGHRVALIQFSNVRGAPSIEAAKDVFGNLLSSNYAVRFRKDTEPTEAELSRVLEQTANADVVVIALYQRLVSGRGEAGLHPRQTQMVRRLIAGGRPVVLVTFGNPYAVTTFRQADAFLVAYDQLMETNTAAARVLRGEQPPRGRLPITVDPFPFGAGLDAVTPEVPSEAVSGP
jgi:beta-N-acetylhexosaminidase